MHSTTEMMKPLILPFTSLLVILSPYLCAEEFAEPREQIRMLGQLTAAPLIHDAEGYPSGGSAKAIYFDALSWKGKPTRVFAWLGIPPNRSGKVPGMVLVHGGGGSADQGWVQKWNERGFAAISIAVEGQTDQLSEPDANGRRGWKSHSWVGPVRSGIYEDSAVSLTDQWMYHAVADCILANSLLRSMPEVDATKIGMMGFSWGGVITSTVMGIDSRFAFGVSVYGCGHLGDAQNQYGRALGENKLYQQAWDPMLRMDRVNVPVLWLTWPEDSHFPMDCVAATYRGMPGPRMVSMIPSLGHSGGPPVTRPESYAFAESVVTTGSPWCQQVEVTSGGKDFVVKFKSTRPLDKAVLITTADTGFTGGRKWVESPATLELQGGVWRASAPIPAATEAWFINVCSGDLVVSSDYQEKK
jgi:dienelactone hydrolase